MSWEVREEAQARDAALEAALAWFPLYLKTCLCLQGPIQWKGGTMHPLFKSGDASIRTNYRDIHLFDFSGKGFSGLQHFYASSGLELILQLSSS